MLQSPEIERLIGIISRFPGMGTRSAHRVVLYLLKNKKTIMENLINTSNEVYQKSIVCNICNNIDTRSPCRICASQKRDLGIICVISSISDLWSIERAGFYNGTYHIIGGKLSAVDGVRPEDLGLEKLRERLKNSTINEVIIAMSADIDGQTTMFFIKDCLKNIENIRITTLSHGMPIGGEFEYLDDGTIIAAFNERKVL
ncbi:MAG: recombination mediator RecR [Holosporales bacterium]|jgi:recombination protein RecR|nr:recombination mediator RecR [Holosporales bacterium]